MQVEVLVALLDPSYSFHDHIPHSHCASGSGQQDGEGKGQGDKEVVAKGQAVKEVIGPPYTSPSRGPAPCPGPTWPSPTTPGPPWGRWLDRDTSGCTGLQSTGGALMAGPG
ncbi:hypothetical protein QJQ45_027342 [Haematococcus lacustris]|nr:hypothetical protein QJQ45_027342 [Haematococcus lacustris]